MYVRGIQEPKSSCFLKGFAHSNISKYVTLVPFVIVHVIFVLPLSLYLLIWSFCLFVFQVSMHCSIRKEADILWLLSIEKMVK